MRDEAQLIADIRERFGSACADLFVDDGAALPAVSETDEERVVTADVVVEEVHFSFDLSSAESAGHRALVQNISDLAAMAAAPVGFVWTLSIPKRLFNDEGTSSATLAAFIDGAAAAARAYNVPLFGGDLSSTAGPLVCAISAFGDAPARRPLRSGAKPTDRLFVGKRLGESAAGLRMLLAGGRDAGAAAVRAHEFPSAQVALGLALRQRATALMDISDGLAMDLYRLVEASGCGATLAPTWAECIGPHASSDDVLFGGEDYALLFTLAAETSTDEVECLAAEVGVDGALFEIGTMTESVGTVIDANGTPIPRRGFDHFSKP